MWHCPIVVYGRQYEPQYSEPFEVFSVDREINVSQPIQHRRWDKLWGQKLTGRVGYDWSCESQGRWTYRLHWCEIQEIMMSQISHPDNILIIEITCTVLFNWEFFFLSTISMTKSLLCSPAGCSSMWHDKQLRVRIFLLFSNYFCHGIFFLTWTEFGVHEEYVQILQRCLPCRGLGPTDVYHAGGN